MTAIKREPPIGQILRYAYRPPWWLPKGARIEWRSYQRDSVDSYILRAEYIHGWGEGADYRTVEDEVTAHELRATASDGMLVDAVLRKMRAMLARLRPHTPTDDMIGLAMQAIQERDALDVLTDALLEDGTLTPLPEAKWTTPAMARQYLSQQARQWAEMNVADRWGSERQSEEK